MLKGFSLYLTVIFILVFLFLLIRFIWRDPEKRAAIAKSMSKFRALFHHRALPEKDLEAMSSGNSTLPPPTVADVTRYRYQHGANIGSVLILEKWLTSSMYQQSASGTAELAAVESWVNTEGLQKAKERFENHWRAYVSDADLDWLRDTAKATTVRLPIGYFTLGPAYCQGTPFQKYSDVYQNAWTAAKDLVRRCNDRGIGVLVDLHGLPGGANNQEHSGTNSGKAELWTNQAYRDLAVKCLCFIANETKTMEGVIGIQIANEVDRNIPIMYTWYDRVLSELSRIDPTMPVYISDGWDLKKAISYVQDKNSARTANCNPVVIDTHLYWCFSDADKQRSAQEITNLVPSTLVELDGKDGNVVDRGAAQVLVGEHSCVLDQQSWSRSPSQSKDQLIRNFGNTQCQRFQQRAAGATFWTYRMDWMNGGEWGFRQMNESQAISPPKSLTLSIKDVRSRVSGARTQQAQRKQTSASTHAHYWDTTYPGQYEHWRFDRGWDLGFCDAAAFFEMRSQRGLGGADKLALLDLWCLKRLRQSGQAGSPFAWEFEQGIRQGVKDFYDCVAV